jgi:alkanesulfonate monooxygenase SsuD/methylene tetrahydromethanopterin reductase-like flavin-dependent oxidoreductase (luciferase family)
MTGELADGWFTNTVDTDSFQEDLGIVRKGAAAAGRSLPDDFLTVTLTTGCVLRPGESATSQRVLQRVGAFAIVGLHAAWEHSAVAVRYPQWLLDLANRYRDEYVSKMKTPADRRYRQVHEGHLIYLKPGEERYLPENLIRAASLTGTGEEIIARIKKLEAAGLKQVALQIVNDGRALIEEFSREVIAKY